MASSVPTVAQGSCFRAKDSSAGNMRQNNGGIVLLQERLGTKEPALFPSTTSSFQKILYHERSLILLNMRFNGTSASLRWFCKYSTARGVWPLARIVCAANASQASLGLCILKYQTSVFKTKVERGKGLKPPSWVKKIFSTAKDLLSFLPGRLRVMPELPSIPLSFAPELPQLPQETTVFLLDFQPLSSFVLFMVCKQALWDWDIFTVFKAVKEP